MTLRARFTLVTAVLVNGFLVAAFLLIVRLQETAFRADLSERARRIARSVAFDGDDDGPEAERPPRDEERPADAGPGPPPPPPPLRATRPDRRLPAEPDGAHVEVVHVDPGRANEGPLRVVWRAYVGAPRVVEADLRAALRAWIADGGAHDVRLVATGGEVTYTVAVRELGAVGGPPRGPEGRRPGPPRGRGMFALAFVEDGPAARAHQAKRWTSLGWLFGGAGLGVLLSWVAAGRMLAPVRRAAEAAEAVRTPEARLPSSGNDDELGRLVTVLNGMLGRLEDAARRERQFLATASHELRRPLASLLGELELASAPGRDAGALAESVRLSRTDALAMSRLVEDLLHHARARADQVPLALRDVGVRETVDEAVARSRRALGRPDADVGTAGVEDLVARGDADALRQVVENLVSNALVHAGPGARVDVVASRDGDGVVLAVEDDGPGIPPDELGRVFEPFGRGDRARGAPGFGLGLAIARELARALGGTLEAVSPCRPQDRARPGARFVLRLPGPARPAGSLRG